MKLEHSFVRAVPGGAPGDPPILGTDAAPTDATYLDLDNVFRCPQYGPNAEPINAVSLAYDGPVGAPDLTFNVYLWDEESQLWFDFGTVDIVVGEIKFISLPNIVDRKDSRQISRISVAFVSNNPPNPAAGTYTFLSSAVTGVSSLDPSAFAGIIAVLNLILADTTAILADTGAIAASVASIDGKIANPMPVVGDVAVGQPASGDPVLIGGQGADGNVHYIATDNSGNLVVSGGSVGGGNNIWTNPQDFTATANVGANTITFSAYTSTVLSSVLATRNFAAAVIKRISSTGVVDTLPVTNVSFAANVLTLSDMTANFAVGDTVLVFVPGPDKSYDQVEDLQRVGGAVADDAPAVGNPVYLGARYLSDIFASVISASGDLAGLVTDQFRRLHVRPAGYDSVGDAVRALIASSLADPQFMDLSQSTAVGSGSNPFNYYIDVDDWEYFSVQFYQTVGTSTKTVRFFATDQDDGTAPTSCNYNDVTLAWFGAAFFTLAAAGTSVQAFERDTALTWRYVKVEITLDLPAADNTWVAYARKRRI